MEAHFGSNLVCGDNTVDTSSKVNDVQAVAIYFSAHWCPPCRGFTPKLVEFYDKVNKNGRKLEIVFVSHDRDDKSFKEYFSTMPWCAVPFDDSDAKEKLITDFNVSGIPKLVFIKKDGSVLSEDGRGKVMEEGSVETFPWY